MNKTRQYGLITAGIAGITLLCILLTAMSNCSKPTTVKKQDEKIMTDKLTETVYFGNGCFWCTEAVFKEIKGVVSVESGYAGGTVKNPSYREVCTGNTGHAEVIRVIYAPAEVSFEDLLEVFFFTHDPTTLNRQGNDVGTQYRSVIFYTIPKQKEMAEKYIAKLTAARAFPNPIVTKVEPYSNYYAAEDYHQDYYELNGHQPYCQVMIKPKLDKLRKDFANKVK
ncbi:MAG TPA: peptide-methionine (S)-S-oxide reductase MsrA [Cytophagaceae bacterium]|jgi:peptide-methionine (S)-S-oxide reductase|nr:peptide-methionine (S)-S-oxide reductase MsrA [Cytophagaceae bacterium]